MSALQEGSEGMVAKVLYATNADLQTHHHPSGKNFLLQKKLLPELKFSLEISSILP